MAEYVEGSLQKAAQGGAAAVVIELNTPGGSLDATQKIVSSLLETPVPAIVWVAPAGSRAASAGTFITLAANLAYMAPGTNIGAASPVGAQGEDIPGTLGDKVKNDAIKNITAIAEARGRPVDWAVSTVEEAASYSASEAVAAGAVDGMAATIEAVLEAADGQTVEIASGPLTLELTGATIEELGMNPFQGLLHLLSDPNIAFILFTIGFYGLLFELQSPNFVTGILGALAIILAFIGFGSLPLNLAGLILIGLAVILFLLEFTVASHGLLTVGGLICFALGAFALYTEPGTPTAPDVQVALPLIAFMTTVTAVFMAFGVIVVLRARREARWSGFGAGGTSTVPAGTAGEVKSPLAPTGSVYAVGEEWTARTADGRTLERGAPVAVIGQEGLTLIVEPTGPGGPSE
jgi:membrane-bound serine protease (ClpP class)